MTSKNEKVKKTNAGNVPGADGFQRLNFLYQACLLIVQDAPKCKQLSSIYGSHIQSIGKKLQLKMDPSIKRTLCKGCKSVLVLGKTASVDIVTLNKKRSRKRNKKQEKFQRWNCMVCQNTKLYPLKP